MAGNPLPPWAGPSIEPKRKFKFLMSIGEIPAWVIKTSGRPQYTVSKGGTHNYLGHQFKFPGRLSYNDLTITLVDPINVDVAGEFLRVLENAGYKRPNQWTEDPNNYRLTFAKRKFVNSLGEISIKVINADGQIAERWTLKNTWISQIKYGDLSYDSEDLLNISVTLVYDYAQVEINQDLLDAN